MVDENAFEFANVVFYGRNLDEYRKMFALTDEDLSGLRVLDCSAGPASFACEAVKFGADVVACDPLYANSADALRQRLENDAASVLQRQQAARHLLHPELTPAEIRVAAMKAFLADFSVCPPNARYVAGKLPQLPFRNEQFDLTLCGNFLFIYSDKSSGGMMDNAVFDYAFHKESLFELMRVTKRETRLYPLQGPGATTHDYLAPLIQELSDSGFRCEMLAVEQRDIIGCERMLRILRPLGSPGIS